jgi:hypothetical protein
MCKNLRKFTQAEYSRVLDNHNGIQLSNAECIRILMNHGASYNQAKNGAYTFLHHRLYLKKRRRGSQKEYNQLLDEIDGHSLSNMEFIHYLERRGFSQGQSKNAVYNYRKSRGLIK